MFSRSKRGWKSRARPMSANSLPLKRTRPSRYTHCRRSWNWPGSCHRHSYHVKEQQTKIASCLRLGVHHHHAMFRQPTRLCRQNSTGWNPQRRISNPSITWKRRVLLPQCQQGAEEQAARSRCAEPPPCQGHAEAEGCGCSRARWAGWDARPWR
ncbi:hypothetical protein BC831DRAFT_155782 [Entophlyctis helioformis]|nr:hypothetical protein BC831DRAFT_155782 [Entophlyctis helioformis]